MKFFLTQILVLISIFSGIAQTKTEFWGVTERGGGFGFGTIFKTDSFGNNHCVKDSFLLDNPSGGSYGMLLEASNGKIYEINGGNPPKYGRYIGDQNGLITEFDPANNIYKIIHQFDGLDGSEPVGGLIEAKNGKLYGVTKQGGKYNDGVIFEYNVNTNKYIKVFDFQDSISGKWPHGTLLEAKNGKLYGVVKSEGSNNKGTIFEFDYVSMVLTKKLELNNDVGYNVGSNIEPLIEIDSGKVYGTTFFGGKYDDGTIFEYNYISDTIIKKIDFDFSRGRIFQSDSGKLYGIKEKGGNNGDGLLFEYDPIINIYTELFHFDNTESGLFPQGISFDINTRSLYGITSQGGENNSGVLYKFDINTGTYKKLFDHNHNYYTDFPSKYLGKQPRGIPLYSSNGKIYVTAKEGGRYSMTILYQYEVANGKTKQVLNYNAPIKGAFLEGGLIQYSSSKLYGTTWLGGVNNDGTLFEYNIDKDSLIKRFDFGGQANLGRPFPDLTLSRSGKIYGITASRTEIGHATLFVYNPLNDSLTEKFYYNDSLPAGPFIQAKNGKFYGLVSGAVNYRDGILYEYDLATNKYEIKVVFDHSNNGSIPRGKLLEASNGKLYGVTQQGGPSSNGTIFEFDPYTNAFNTVYDFNLKSLGAGTNPLTSLVELDSGKLCGKTLSSNYNSYAVIYEFDINTKKYKNLAEFKDSLFNLHSRGSLLYAKNKRIYGLSYARGKYGHGFLYEYNPGTDSLVKKLDFNRINGSGPIAHLIEVDYHYTSIQENKKQSDKIKVYPNPVKGQLNIDLKDITATTAIFIYTMEGKNIYSSENIKNSAFTINTYGWSRGIYFLNLINHKQSQTLKFIHH